MISKSSQLIQAAIAEIENKKEKKLTGIPTGLSNLDTLTSGWQASDLIILGGRPSMGKTAFALSMVRNMTIDYGIPVAFFSLELSSKQLIQRLICIETNISITKLIRGNLKQEEQELVKQLTVPLAEAPLYIDDSPSLSILELEKRALDLVIHQNVKIIIIDYLQLMLYNQDTKTPAQISHRLKILARELNIPIFILSQVSKEVDHREDKRPKIIDLIGFPDIEPNVDIVSFIYRPDYYGLSQWDDDKGERCDGEAEFIIAKNLRGSVDQIRIRFNSRTGLFKSKTKNDRDWGKPIKK